MPAPCIEENPSETGIWTREPTSRQIRGLDHALGRNPISCAAITERIRCVLLGSDQVLPFGARLAGPFDRGLGVGLTPAPDSLGRTPQCTLPGHRLVVMN